MDRDTQHLCTKGGMHLLFIAIGTKMDGYPNSINSQCRESVDSSLNEKTYEKIRQSEEDLKVYLRQAHTRVYSHQQAYLYIYTHTHIYIPVGTCTKNTKETILSF